MRSPGGEKSGPMPPLAHTTRFSPPSWDRSASVLPLPRGIYMNSTKYPLPKS